MFLIQFVCFIYLFLIR